MPLIVNKKMIEGENSGLISIKGVCFGNVIHIVPHCSKLYRARDLRIVSLGTIMREVETFLLSL